MTKLERAEKALARCLEAIKLINAASMPSAGDEGNAATVKRCDSCMDDVAAIMEGGE